MLYAGLIVSLMFGLVLHSVLSITVFKRRKSPRRASLDIPPPAQPRVRPRRNVRMDHHWITQTETVQFDPDSVQFIPQHLIAHLDFAIHSSDGAGRPIPAGAQVHFDGSVARYNGHEFTAPELATALRLGWLGQAQSTDQVKAPEPTSPVKNLFDQIVKDDDELG